MNCPDCHCPRGEPLTVATNSLVTRCHNAFHAVSAPLAQRLADSGNSTTLDDLRPPRHWLASADSGASPARPDDFATETAKDTTPPPPSHHGAAEAVLGHPYTTPIPTAHDGSTGFRFCNACDTVVDVADHECATALPRGECWTVGCRNLSEYEATGHGAANFCATCTAADRGEAFGWVKKPWGHRETMAAKEFAESLLCAMAFDHMRREVKGYYACEYDGNCVFCDAARGGGR